MTTTKLTRDRNYYRQMTNKELVEQAETYMHTNWQELAIVLAERVTSLKRRLDNGHYDAMSDAREWE
jgi:anti-sigma28 factor (negative regulator of flagellin synthesis)